MTSWTVVLNGVAVAGGDIPPGLGPADVVGWLSNPPDGLGAPGLRVEDQSFPQKDGVAHYSDWYEPRILTCAAVSIKADEGCDDPTSARARARQLLRAWDRECGDLELVIFTDVPPGATPDDRAVTGPFGMVGRPRVAEINWLGQGTKAGQALLRFDGADHRLYILDQNGTPGSGVECGNLSPTYSGAAIPTATRKYRLNEAAGTTGPYLSTPAGNDTTYTVNSQVAVVRGLAPLAANLGTSTSIVVTNNLFAPTFFTSVSFASPVSLTMWWRYDGAGVKRILWFDTNTIYGFYTNRIQIPGTVTNYNFSAGTTALLEDGNPHFISIVSRTGVGLKLYVDGVLRETLAYTGIIPGTGNRMSPSTGTSSELSYFNIELSAAQITNTYYRDAGPPATTLDVSGDLPSPMTLTFVGLVTNPYVSVDGRGFISFPNLTVPTGSVLQLDTATGIALLYPIGQPESAADVTPFLAGDPFLTLAAGENLVSFSSFSTDDTGDVDICWRPAVVSA